MVHTAAAAATRLAMARTAAPPWEWPMRMRGASSSPSMYSAAAKSAMLDEKLVLANSPSLAPRPVKSKRRTAMP